MMNIASKIWLKNAWLYDPVQKFFNGNFWEIFSGKFSHLLEGNVIDLACGTGEMRKFITPKTYFGIDSNPEYIIRARKNYPYKNTRFEEGNILKLQMKSQYDCVFLVSAAHHLTDKELLELCGSLKKTGVKCFVLTDGYPIGMFKTVLAWLDKTLGGGEYFRSTEQIEAILQKKFHIQKSGEFGALHSFYRYPFVVATNQ